MRKTREFLLGPEGQSNYYHVVSRTAGRVILFGDDEKEAFRVLMLRQLKFSGLRALAWCFMGNHFHLLLEVPDKEAALRNWSREDYLNRLKMLKGEWSTKLVMAEVERCQEMGAESVLDEIAAGVKERLFDLSMFMKELKMKMTLVYNKKHGRDGTLWQGRFRSVLLEGAGEGDDGSEALRIVAAYIDLNPIRAGLAQVPEGYRWCSYAAAAAGNREARQGLTFAVTGRQRVAWRTVEAEYRCLLYVKGEEVGAEVSVDGYEKGKGGFSQAEIAEVLETGGRLPMAVALRCRVRYFSDGAVMGSQQFVDEFFEDKREGFGVKRKDGGRRMRGAQWGELRVLRDLRKDVVS
ncbi:MAG: transposase [Verrucomicrobiales bacterium]|nr:transposase [Verrucomicrobiales bacterium]